MDLRLDPYEALKVDRRATAEEIHKAFQTSAARFHPDANPHPLAAEEYARINQAFQLLSSRDQRAGYDAAAEAQPAGPPLLRTRLTASRASLPPLREPQIVYALLEVMAEALAAESVPSPPVNWCLVIDRSTSMQGERLDQVKKATIALLDLLQPDDIFSIVSFSDRAEVVLRAQHSPDKGMARAKISAIVASGGTEMLQGLFTGLSEIRRYLNPLAVNHLLLLTDGRTYGDEAECLSLAGLAGNGINIHGLGIGHEWNDAFLDDLAGRTGAHCLYQLAQSPEPVFWGSPQRPERNVCRARAPARHPRQRDHRADGLSLRARPRPTAGR